MVSKPRQLYPVILFIVIASCLYFRGLSSAPFHPDEQTYLYMSGDLERFLAKPSQLFWSPAQETDLRQKYRLRDAPLSRWLIGIGRQIARQPAPQVDWDWSEDWETNRAHGALPAPDLLLVGRWSVAVFFPFSLWLMFQISKSIGGNLSGWTATILLASHALVLLHTRRAMAESGLLFCVLLTLWALNRDTERPYWLALPAALAFNAKQSVAPLAVLCWAVVLFTPGEKRLSLKKRLWQGLLFGLQFVFVTLMLNPVLWSNPWRAALAAWQERTALVNQQVTAIRSVSPELVWESYPQRMFGILAHLFFTQPATADLMNYVADTQAADQAYFAQPLHSLFRNLWGGIVWIFLSLFGFILAPVRARRLAPMQRRRVWLMVAATFVQAVGLVGIIPIPFQRYVLPLIPFQCLWAAKGVEGLMQIPRLLFVSHLRKN